MTKLKVLIVADQDETRSRLRMAAKELGLEPMTGTRVGTGLEIFEAADMMVMDWHLPDADPEQLINAWSRCKTGPIAVIYSELPDSSIVRLLMQYCIWNVVPQPPRYEDLQIVVSTLLRRYMSNLIIHDRLEEHERQIALLRLWVMWIGVGFIISAITVAIMVIRLLER